MRRIALFVFVASLVFGCSSPKYSYYFDHQKIQSKKQTNERSLATNDLPQPKTEPVVYASSDKGVGADAGQTRSNLDKSRYVKTYPTLTDAKHSKSEGNEEEKIRKTEKLDDKKSSNEASSEDGDPKKNGWAIAGFVTSLVGWFLPWPILILGVIFSAMGMKSQKKGLAIAGLAIGLVGLVIVLVAVSSGAM